MVTNKFKRYL